MKTSNEKCPVVLTIEDEKSVRDSFRLYLEDYDYVVLEAENGREGLELFERDKPDLVLLDLRMPEVDGLDVLSTVRELSPDTPVIVVSGAGMIKDAVKALQLGAWDYLLKPIEDLSILRHSVEVALERARLIQENRAYQEHLEKEVAKRTAALKQTAELLQESEEKYRLLVENANEAIFVAQDGMIKFFNPKTIEISSYSREELDSKPFAEIIHPDDREMVVKSYLKRLQGEDLPHVYSFRIIDKRGDTIWVEINAIMITWEGKPATLNFLSDTTERVQAEYMLRESEAKFRNIVESSPMGMHMYLLEEAGKLVFIGANPAADRILGVDNKQFMGKTIEEAFPTLTETEVPEVYRKAAAEGISWSTEQINYEENQISGAYEVYAFQTSPGRMVALFLDITDRKQAEEKINRQVEQLEALHTIDGAIASNVELNYILEVLVKQIKTQLTVDATSILLHEIPTQTLVCAAGDGFYTQNFQGTRIRIGTDYAGRVALDRRTIHIPDLSEIDPSLKDFSASITEENFVTYFGVPLIAKGELKGVLQLFHRHAIEPDQDWWGFLDILARQSAIAIDNATLFDNLQRSNLEITLAYDSTLEGWARGLELRDKETEGHSQRVTELTFNLARAIGVPKDKLIYVRRGALLHDIGKMGIPDAILQKPGPLSSDEWEIMHQHPVYAFELLSSVSYLSPALEIPYCHHEKWDGNGYPRGLRGEHIPLAARVFAVVDVWDALLSARSYREAWSEEQTLEYLQDQSGKHFDPQVVEAFMKIVEDKTMNQFRDIIV